MRFFPPLINLKVTFSDDSFGELNITNIKKNHLHAFFPGVTLNKRQDAQREAAPASEIRNSNIWNQFAIAFLPFGHC